METDSDAALFRRLWKAYGRFPVSSLGGRSPGVPSGCVDPMIDLMTSLCLLCPI